MSQRKKRASFLQHHPQQIWKKPKLSGTSRVSREVAHGLKKGKKGRLISPFISRMGKDQRGVYLQSMPASIMPGSNGSMKPHECMITGKPNDFA